MKSLAERLLEQLDIIVQANDELLDASTINHDPQRGVRLAAQGVVTLVPDSIWGPLDDTQRRLQRKALELWRPWLEQVQLLFSGDPPEANARIAKAASSVSLWLERSSRDLSIPDNLSKAKDVFRTHTAPFVELLRSLGSRGEPLIAIPDTNVILRSPDITKYDTVLEVTSYTVFLVPGVLAEVDEAKINHRNTNVRDRARKFSQRLKGWRNQGKLANGVKVQGNIYVQVEGREPNFDTTLSWLRHDVVDDRIVASILEIQRRYPTRRVVLLTGDSVMLAKADLANIPTADTPDPDL